MRRFRLAVLIIMAMIWFIIILPYLLIQTTIGANYASKLISNHNQSYTLSVGRISHSLSKPYEITLEQVILQNNQQTETYLNVSKLIVGLKKDNLFQLNLFDYLVLEDGNIGLTLVAKNIEATLLQLKNININYNDDDNQLMFNSVYGGIKPWSQRTITERSDTQFNFTAQKISYNRFNLDAVYARGFQKDHTMKMTNFGGNINQGFFTAKFNITPDNAWDVEQLKIDKLNFQSSINSLNINDLLSYLPKTTIHQISILDSSISLPNFILEKSNLSAKNLIYDNQLQLQKSDLTFNAQNIVINDELIEQPLIHWNKGEDSTISYQAMARWNKGSFKVNGQWQPENVIVDSFIASGIRYQLPENWYHSFAELPLNELPNIHVKQFIMMPSLIIDTNPDFPFQFSAFQAFGNDIIFSNQNDQPEFNGNILFKAESGTLNTIELVQPDIILNLMPPTNFLSFSALINEGMIEGNATLLGAYNIENLFLKSYAVNSDVLPFWHLIENPPSAKKFELNLSGKLQPLALNGTLQSNNQNFTVINNNVIDR